MDTSLPKQFLVKFQQYFTLFSEFHWCFCACRTSVTSWLVHSGEIFFLVILGIFFFFSSIMSANRFYNLRISKKMCIFNNPQKMLTMKIGMFAFHHIVFMCFYCCTYLLLGHEMSLLYFVNWCISHIMKWGSLVEWSIKGWCNYYLLDALGLWQVKGRIFFNKDKL